MQLQLSRRALSTPPSPIRRLASYAAQAKAAGRKVLQLNIGQPDIPSPPEFFEGLRQCKDPVLAYEQSGGNESLRLAWAEYFRTHFSVKLAPSDFLITTGASEALIFAFMLLCDPGDEIVVFDPTYANYIGFAAVSGVKLVPVPCRIDEGFALPPRRVVESSISARTRAILVCNPNNPTGTVYSRESLRELVNLCRERNLFLISDEAYREYVYDGIKPGSVLELAPDDDRIVVVDSLSKRYSLCGARIGALITINKELQRCGLHIAQMRLATATLEQAAAAWMLERIKDSYVEAARKEYQDRRDLLISALQSLPGVEVPKPEGAFYVCAKFPVKDADHFAQWLLSDFSHGNATVFVAPASGFYLEPSIGRSQLRLAYVVNRGELSQAVDVLGQALQVYPEISKN